MSALPGGAPASNPVRGPASSAGALFGGASAPVSGALPGGVARWLLVLGLLLVLARLRAQLVEVLDTDETIFHAVAQRMAAGDALYVDVVDLKPPGIFAFYAAVRALFGPGLFAVHAVTTALVAATAAAVGLAARALAPGRPLAGWLAAAAYLLFHGVGDAGTGASSCTEQLATLPVALGMALLLGGAGGGRTFAAGLLLGAAVLCKPQAGAAACAAFLALGLRGEGRARRLAWLGLGLGTLPLLTYALFAARGHAAELVRWSFSEGVAYAAQAAVSPWREAWNLGAFLALHAAPLSLGAVALRVFAREGAQAAVPGRWPLAQGPLLLAAWLGLALLATAAGGRFYWNYFLLASPPLAVLGGVGAALAWPRLGRGLRALLCVGALVPTVASQLHLWRSEERGQGSLRAGHRALAAAAAPYLGPGEEVFAFGSAAPVYYALGRAGATPYLITDYLFGFLHPTLFAEPDRIRAYLLPARREELGRALAEPRVTVVVDAPYSAWEGYPVERLPAVVALLRDAGFTRREQVGPGSVWVRRR